MEDVSTQPTIRSQMRGRAYQVLFACLALVLMVVAGWEGLRSGEVSHWAEVSGWLMMIVGLFFARSLDERFDLLLRRLKQRGALLVQGNEFDELMKSCRRNAGRGAAIGGIVFPAGLMLAYYWYYQLSDNDVAAGQMGVFRLKIILEFIGAVLLGRYGGRMVANGFLGKRLRREGAAIEVTVGHPDAAGGLRVVGDYFLYQARLIMLPVIFFAFWFVMAPIWAEVVPPPEVPVTSASFENWKGVFGIAFLGMLAVEVAAFVMPMLFFHREMQRNSDAYLQEADALGSDVMQTKKQILEETDPDRVEALRTRLGALEQKIGALENPPEWPIDASIRKKFAWGNLLLFAIPFVAKLDFISADLIGHSMRHFFG